MMSFKQFIRESYSSVHDDAILMPLMDFIDVLQVLESQKTDGERIVEIRENYPEPGTYAVRFIVRATED
jgi:hypothetical protein